MGLGLKKDSDLAFRSTIVSGVAKRSSDGSPVDWRGRSMMGGSKCESGTLYDNDDQPDKTTHKLNLAMMNKSVKENIMEDKVVVVDGLKSSPLEQGDLSRSMVVRSTEPDRRSTGGSMLEKMKRMKQEYLRKSIREK